MDEVRLTTIVPIALYCFVLGGYFISLAVNAVLGNKAGVSSTGLGMWLFVIALVVLTGGMIAVGMGILNAKRSHLKVLFLGLTTSIPLIALFLIASLVLILMGFNILTPFCQIIQSSPGGWFAFLSFYLSQIIILYYLSSKEVLSCFGDSSPLI